MRVDQPGNDRLARQIDAFGVSRDGDLVGRSDVKNLAILND